MVAARFVWHGLRKQVAAWARACIPCQTSKVHRHVQPPYQTFVVPPVRFYYIHVDLVGPLPYSRGYTHLLTVVDRFTRWPEALLLSDTSAASCARALALHWVARFGVPAIITTDRGAQFTSSLWAALAQLYGSRLQQTTAYHPQANGMVERFHRQLKASLCARLTGPDWADQLPWVLLGIRTAPKADLGTSSAELVYGSPLRVPGDIIPLSSPLPSSIPLVLASLRARVGSLAPGPASSHGSTAVHVPADLQDCEFVFLRRDSHRPPLQLVYQGPFRVLKRGTVTFTLQVGTRQELVSVSRLKPAHLDPDRPVLVAQPPCRGRPLAGTPVSPAASLPSPLVPPPPSVGCTLPFLATPPSPIPAGSTFPPPPKESPSSPSRGPSRLLPRWRYRPPLFAPNFNAAQSPASG
ncbi:uncharacterized protein LOC144592254 [Rhinoraja longicauda]